MKECDNVHCQRTADLDYHFVDLRAWQTVPAGADGGTFVRKQMLFCNYDCALMWLKGRSE